MPKYTLEEAMRRLRDAQATKNRGLNGQRLGLAASAIPRSVQIPFRDVLSAPGRALEARATEEFGPEAAGLTWPQQLGRLAGRGMARITGAYQGTESPIATNLLNKIGGMPMQPAPRLVPPAQGAVPAAPTPQTGVFLGGKPWQAPEAPVGPGQGRVYAAYGTDRMGNRLPMGGRAAEGAGMGIPMPGPDFAERTRRNAVQFGLAQPREGDINEKVQYLSAKLQRTRNTSERRVLGGLLDQAQKEQAAQGEQGRALERGAQAGAVELGVARANAEATLGKEVAGLVIEQARLAQREGASRANAIARALSAAKDQVDFNNPQAVQALVESVDEAFGGGGQQAGGQPTSYDQMSNETGPNPMVAFDADQSGDLNADEQAKATNFMKTTLSRFEAMSPEQKAKWKNHPRVLQAMAIKKQLAKRAERTAAGVFRG